MTATPLVEAMGKLWRLTVATHQSGEWASLRGAKPSQPSDGSRLQLFRRRPVKKNTGELVFDFQALHEGRGILAILRRNRIAPVCLFVGIQRRIQHAGIDDRNFLKVLQGKRAAGGSRSDQFRGGQRCIPGACQNARSLRIRYRWNHRR